MSPCQLTRYCVVRERGPRVLQMIIHNYDKDYNNDYDNDLC